MATPMWAPWRMEYILGQRSTLSTQCTCIFCEFAALEPARMREALVLVVQPHALVCLNRYPFASSHVMIVPRRHVSDLGDLQTEEYAALMELVRETVARVRLGTNAEGLNVGINLGKAAGAGIAEHLHVHVVPRWSGDTNFMPVIADVRVMPEHLDASWARLAPLFADLPGERAPS